MKLPLCSNSFARSCDDLGRSPVSSVRSLNPRRILLVDDNEELRNSIEKALRAAGHDVVTAGNGKEALACAVRYTIDVVLLDVLMPEKDGLETLRELRREHSRLPVIIMSGGGQFGCEVFIGAARVLGARMILLKPFTAQEVIEAIDVCFLREQKGS